MTDIATGETPSEFEAAPPALAATDAPASPEASEPAAERALPFEIEHAIGATRQRILDEFVDSERAELSMGQIKLLLPDVLPGTVEACVRREWEAGRLLRISPGRYKLAPASPPEAPKPATPPAPEQVGADGMTDEEWMQALERWAVDPSSWDVEKLGPRPNEPGNKVASDIRQRFADRLRKRQERQAAVARQAAADVELRDRLIAATHGNFVAGPALDDVAPIQAAMEIVPLDVILGGIRYKCDKKLYPPNEPARSWREERLLKSIAERYSRYVLVPSMVDAWSKAGQAQAPKAQSSPPAGPMPDNDIDGGYHDAAHAEPGPHTLSGPNVAAKPVERAEPSPLTPEPAASENASTVPPGNGISPSDDGAAEPSSMAAALLREFGSAEIQGTSAPQPDDGKPVAVGRDQVLAAFNRPRQPTPAAPQPRQPERQAGPVEPKMTDEAWDEICGGFFVGNLDWSRRKWGPAPGENGCRVPLAVLKRNKLA